MNLLIKNVTLLPMDGKNEIIDNTNIYIKGDKIAHIGEKKEDVKADRKSVV